MRVAALGLAMTLVSTVAFAQSSPPPSSPPPAPAPSMQGMPMGSPPPADGNSPATQAYRDAMNKMMQTNIPYTGDADKDFVAAMIVHHQAAIDMAKAELQYGRDPHIKKLAQRIVTAQEKEITMMQRWEQRAPKPAR